MTKQGFKIFGEKDQWEERQSLHMMKIFRLNLLLRASDSLSKSHLPACPSIPLGQHLTPAPSSDESLWTLHLCLPRPVDGKMRDRSSHCLDIWAVICLRGQTCSGALPHELGRTQARDPVSYMLWFPKDQRLSELPEEIQRNTLSPAVALGEHEGFALRFKVKDEQLGDVWPNPCGSGVIPLQIQVLHCQHIWEEGCFTHRQMCVLEADVWL